MTVLPDGRTVRVSPAPAKGTKRKLDQGRLRESRTELDFSFDQVLGEHAGQEEVYDQVKACVRSPFEGDERVPVSHLPLCRGNAGGIFRCVWNCEAGTS